jgi:hypothetical protein
MKVDETGSIILMKSPDRFSQRQKIKELKDRAASTMYQKGNNCKKIFFEGW